MHLIECLYNDSYIITIDSNL